MSNQDADPIFVHSLFRSGSTYLFNVFRRSEAGYWCYQEPLNEKLLRLAESADGFTVGPKGASEQLRHPEMDRPHAYEFHVAEDVVKTLFKPRFSYRLFFSQGDEDMQGVNEYFSGLQKSAKGRPLFQCCRTTGRVQGLKKAFSGQHILLWRNPWDQWWSYKNDRYFGSRNLFISDAENLPAFLVALKQEIGIPPLTNVADKGRFEFFSNRKLSAAASYILFYAIWCHAMLEALPHCDMDINIDQLSESDIYREQTLERLSQLGINGVHFDDCSVPRGLYGEEDGQFFTECEQRVHRALLEHGYSAEKLAMINALAVARQDSIVDTSSIEHRAIRDAMRARSHAMAMETELSETQSELFNARNQLRQLERRVRAGQPRTASPVKH